MADTTNPSSRVEAGLALLRAMSSDGRQLTSASAASLIETLFAEQECPPVGQFAFWSTPEGDKWLYAERESSAGRLNYVLAAGSVAGGRDQLLLTGVGVVDRTAQYGDGALFDDSGEADAAKALRIQRRIGEPEFVSHVGVMAWSDAMRFTSFKETSPSQGQVISDDLVEDGGVGAAGGDDHLGRPDEPEEDPVTSGAGDDTTGTGAGGGLDDDAETAAELTDDDDPGVNYVLD